VIRQKMEYTLCVGTDYSLPVPMYQPNEGLELMQRSYMKCSQTCLNIPEFGLDLWEKAAREKLWPQERGW
jgi:hypothetical protein